VIYVLREIEGIEQFRIRQLAVDRFHVQVVKNQRYQMESESRIRAGLEKRLRAPLEVTVEYLPVLAPEASGKFRQVISDVSHGPGGPAGAGGGSQLSGVART
jgi:phenylacetate-CoA ligase